MLELVDLYCERAIKKVLNYADEHGDSMGKARAYGGLAAVIRYGPTTVESLKTGA